jgi:hypothetical protein
MSQFAKIADHKFLVRDLNSKAVLNTDVSLIKKHEKYIHNMKKEENRNKEINNIKEEMKEIKQMLKILLENKKDMICE